MRTYKYHYIPLLFLLLVLTVTACRDDNDVETKQENEDFYDFMLDWYYWNNEIPSINPSLYPDIYSVLEAIRYRPLDRWSNIYSYEEFMSLFQDSKYIGHGFSTMRDPDGRYRISYIFRQTDLYEAGVRRGWIIEEVNGTPTSNVANINPMFGPNDIGVSNTISFVKPDGSSKKITSSKKEIVMNTVLHYDVLEVDNKNVAYLVLQGFYSPTLQELIEAFEYFSSLGAEELILDLRYNGGGITEVARQLASLIGGEPLRDKVFINYEYNQNKAFEHNRTLFFEDTHQFALNLDRLITICSRFTASASELIITSLAPYIPVYIVGNTTYGKPMGSNIFGYPRETPKYAFAPITFKTRNADGFGDYFDGLQADIYAPDDLTRDFGDPEEEALQQALQIILFGAVAKGMPSAEQLLEQPRDQMTGVRYLIGAH